MQTFLQYLTRKPDELGIVRGFGFDTFFQAAGPFLVILEVTLLVLCGFLIAGFFHRRGAVLYRVYVWFSVVPLAWGIGIFTWRLLEIIDLLGHHHAAGVHGVAELPPFSEALTEITAVLLTCAVLTGIFLALSPLLRPQPASASGTRPGSHATT
jgi:hypothetical protein